jgi:ribonuclease P protein component
MGTAGAPQQPQPRAFRLTTLKRRAEFLRIRKGARAAADAFVLEAKRRAGGAGEGALAGEARFGFTVSKQVGGAVERNRIRRRLKAAVRGLAQQHAQHDFDYVVIARRPALDLKFTALVADLAKAFERVHARPGRERTSARARR